MTDSPTPNTPLTADDVNLLRKGDWLLDGDRPVQCEGFEEPGFAIIPDTNWGHVAITPNLTRFLGRPDQSGWIPHAGGPNPAPGLRVDVRWADGTINTVISNDLAPYWPVSALSLTLRKITHWRPHVPSPTGERKGPIRPEPGWLARSLAPEAPPQPKGEVEAAVEYLTAQLQTHDAGKSSHAGCFSHEAILVSADRLRTLLSALTASQAREARAVEALRVFAEKAALIDDFHVDAYTPDWSPFIAAKHYRKAATIVAEFIDNGEDGG